MTVRRDVPVVLGLWLITVVGQASVGPVAEVRLIEGRVQIKATAVPVSEVLDRLSRTTGMKVVYDGAPPTDRLTASIDAGSETEALSRLLEGLGLTYAFKMDAGGRHVETLFVTSAPSTHRPSSGTTAMAAFPGAAASNSVEESENEVLMPEEQEAPIEPPPLAQPSPEGIGMTAGTPGSTAGQMAGAPAVTEQNPAFPSGASLPTPGNPFPANPGFPAFPGPASYP